jgi:hypothetical protein
MNKKILVIAISISLSTLSAHAMWDGVRKFFLPYPVMGHTYKTSTCNHNGSPHVHTHRYKLAPNTMPGGFHVPDAIGNSFATPGGHDLIRDKNGEFFVEKSAEQKIKEEQALYDQGTHDIQHMPNASFKSVRVLYRDYLGKYGLAFVLWYPRSATLLKYGAMAGGLYGAYHWMFKSKTKDADLELEDAVIES